MNYWAFIMTAYGLTLTATLGLLVQSLIAMRDAETAANLVGERN
jgi:heme exporter protein D